MTGNKKDSTSIYLVPVFLYTPFCSRRKSLEKGGVKQSANVLVPDTKRKHDIPFQDCYLCDLTPAVARVSHLF